MPVNRHRPIAFAAEEYATRQLPVSMASRREPRVGVDDLPCGVG